MWNKLRARHYSILILAAVVALETSAIAIDRFFTRADNTAFEVVGQFRNNSYFDHFKVAEAKSNPIPQNLNQLNNLPKPTIVLPVQENHPAPVTPKPEKVAEVTPVVVKEVKTVQAPVEPPKVDPEKWIEYLVRKGDSLAAISGVFQTQPDSIKAANADNLSSGVKTGQKIKIPVSGARLMYSVKSGDTLSKIGSRFGIALQDLLKANNLKDPVLQVGQKIELPVKIQGKVVEMASAPVNETPEKKTKSLEKLAMVAPSKLALVKTNSLEMVSAPAQKPALGIVPADLEKKPAPSTMVASVKAETPVVMEKAKAAEPVVKAPVTGKTLVASALQAPALQGPVAEMKAPDAEIKIVSHTVKSGENLASLARQYKTSITQIVANNNLPKSELKPGQKVQIPVNKKFYRVLQVTSRKVDVSTKLGMPVRGSLTDPYGWRKHPVYHRRLFHAGVDFAAPRGTPINSAMSGTVIYAGWLHGYGKLIVIRHPNGLSTRYGHCSSIRVSRGQTVRKGQIIGGVGSTGTATGNHLHFEVRRNGTTINPLVALNGR